MQKAERAKRVEKLLRDLYKSSYRDAKDRNPPRVEGTCEWFTSHDRFQAWKGGETCGLLWVSADPGCGKSVLSRYLVDGILPSSASSTTCYFFFKDDFDDQKSAAGALCCLLWQLFKERPALLQDSLLKQFGEDGDRLLNSFRDLWHILVSVSNNHESSQIVCVLDALDECGEHDRRLLTQTLNDFYLKKGTKTKLKFLVTSRPYVNIEQNFHGLQTELPTIRLRGEDQSESDKIAREIDLVIEARITPLCRKLQLGEQGEKAMRHELGKRPSRTYLWVHLVFDILECYAGHPFTQIEDHIRNIPVTVEDAYDKILSRSPDKNMARKLLHMVLAAKRPLTLEEMAAAMTIRRNHTLYSQLKIESRRTLRIWVRELCGLFVSIVDDKIYLLHQTATEFLVERVEDRESQNDHLEEDNTRYEWRDSFSPGSSNLILGSVCAQLLLFPGVVDDVGEHFGDLVSKKPESLEPLDKNYPLLSYSVEHWAAHLRDASSTEDLPLSNMLRLCSGSYSACLVQVPKLRGYSRSYMRAKELTALVTASILGLEAVTRHLLKLESTDANEGDPIFKLPPLSWAVMGGHRAVFDTFIEAEARCQEIVHRLKRLFSGWGPYVDPDARNKDFMFSPFRMSCTRRKGHTTPLGWAVCYGDAYMVERLLATHRVAISNEMLCEAAKNDYGGIMRALLATGRATVDCRDSQKRTPLSYAAEYGREKVVQQLLATGKADVNSMDRFGKTPLHHAVREGHEGVVRQLLAMNGC
jgi:hypothetical protein